ncbi:D-2-hydroxyacid dehydrogenase [Pseudomonas anguilliseptica]|uniref:D-2-hydroxyacid dehydrogenase n=1 Tax=Pseudomonas anguilliseptica TaxID=53406 RepID=UPI0022B016A0|nr:D-2-hydroxyacid dehydrogenase [Pseudomonas anguilliseptica]MCZ4322234.1 D-2-hydroxyacid dehydrogenase [Pseudomonas anguilliseptica]
MRVLIAEGEHRRYAALLREQAPGLEVFGSDQLGDLQLQASSCPVWLGQPDLLAALLRQGARPQWLQSTWAGIMPLLAADLPTDYRLSRAVGIFGQVMAEYVLCHLLAHERQLLARLAAQVEQRWDNRLPRSLAGRKVLIVGTGDIGLSVAQFLVPFGMQLLGIASSSRHLPPFRQVAGLDELPSLVGEADYLINLLPDTPATRDIYDAALFAACKPSALFINAGRGVAVVDQALVSALQQGQLAGAVIDVCREEPLPAGHPFWDAPRLLLTGHSAAPTDPHLLVKLFVDNLARWQVGSALRGQVDFVRGY